MQQMFGGFIAFNQPLILNTSSVTNMYGMFKGTQAFNQPLTLDTSSVTDMREMFAVCSCARLIPTQQFCVPTRTSPPVVYAPHFESAVFEGVRPAAESRHVQCHNHVQDVLLRLQQLGCVQPAAESRHVQSDGHEQDVCGVLLRSPQSQQLRVPTRTSLFYRTRPISNRQGSVFNQPLSLDTSSVTNMQQMFEVCS